MLAQSRNRPCQSSRVFGRPYYIQPSARTSSTSLYREIENRLPSVTLPKFRRLSHITFSVLLVLFLGGGSSSPRELGGYVMTWLGMATSACHLIFRPALAVIRTAVLHLGSSVSHSRCPELSCAAQRAQKKKKKEETKKARGKSVVAAAGRLAPSHPVKLSLCSFNPLAWHFHLAGYRPSSIATALWSLTGLLAEPPRRPLI